MDKETAQRLYHAFDPTEPLRTATANRYVSREDSVVREFRQQLEFTDDHRFLVAGPVGSGKSTELFRMYAELQQDTRRVTVLLDLVAQFDVNALSAGQVVFLVALALLKSADSVPPELMRELESTYLGMVHPDDRRTLDLAGLLGGLGTFVAGAVGGGLAADAAKAATDALKTVDLRTSLPGKGFAFDKNDPRAHQLTAVLGKVLRHVRQKTNRRHLVLLDGLDKVRGKDRIDELFCSGLLACTGVQGLELVCAAPPSLRFDVGYKGRTGFTEMLRLGLFKVFQRTGGTHEDGLARMHEILERRIRDADLDPDVILHTAPDGRRAGHRALVQSGGLVRDLMHLIRRAAMSASQHVGASLTGADLEEAIRKRALDYLDSLNLGRERLLYETWTQKQRPEGDEVDLLLNDNLILTYDNGSPWCRPHPLVMDHLRMRYPDLVGD